MCDRMTRRQMLRSTVVAGAGVWLSTRGGRARGASPNEKLNVAVIGCGGRGSADLKGVASQNIVALCDVDEERAAKAFEAYPKAKKYHDFRKMFDEMHRQIDAVVVATPDHVHAPASMMAMKLGKHVFCQKPLTHSVDEARQMALTAARQKVATQMGTQHHCKEYLIRTVELVQSGLIGDVREAHSWSNRPIWPQAIERPTETPPVPPHLDWDLWLGPAPERPYHPAYVPFKWRGWWDFGTGALGDMGCHIMNVANWALKLGPPSSVEAESSGVYPETGPLWSIIRYEFPARGPLPPATLTWHDGGKLPPEELFHGYERPSNGTLFVGQKGAVLAPHGRTPVLLPESQFPKDQEPEPFLPRPKGIHDDWIDACKTGEPAKCNFGYAGPLTETVLLGNLALRIGKKIEWDPASLQAKNCPEADQYIRRDYREGWTL